MTIALMRGLDYWMGRPLCFFFSCVDLIFKLAMFKRKYKEGPPQKILFIKLSEAGAIILSFSLLKRVKSEYPQAQLYFLTLEENKGVVRLFADILDKKNIFTIKADSPRSLISSALAAIARLRKEKLDVVFDLEFFCRFTAVLSYLSGACKRIGFYRYSFEGLYRGSLFTHKINYNPLLHAAKLYLSLWQSAKEKEINSPEQKENIEDRDIALPVFVSNPKVRAKVEDRLTQFAVNKKIILVNPGEGILPLREWPLESFFLLCKGILQDQENRIIFVGISSKKAEALALRLRSDRCANWVGKTSIEELLELYVLSDALLTNDSGLAHLASLTDIRKFVFFGPESPQVFAPLGRNTHIIYSHWPCSPCLSVLNNRGSLCKDNKCLKALRYEDALELIRKTL